MALIDELKQRRETATRTLAQIQQRIADENHSAARVTEGIADLDRAIAALEPAPAPIDYTEQDGTRSQQELEDIAPVQPDPPSAELRSVPGAEEEVRDQFDDEPSEFISILKGDPAVEPESGLHGEPEPTELDAEPASVLDNPELLAAVERAEATLAIDAQTCEPIYPHPQPAYVGLQDPDLDADWDAMKARQEADKPKPLTDTWHNKFGIFGKREDA